MELNQYPSPAKHGKIKPLFKGELKTDPQVFRPGRVMDSLKAKKTEEANLILRVHHSLRTKPWNSDSLYINADTSD
jgi:hypothetical protein